MRKIVTLFLACLVCFFQSQFAGYDVICVAAPSVDLNVQLPQEDAQEGHGGSMIVSWEDFQNYVSLAPRDNIKISAGGSGANTIRAMGHLGNHSAMIGRIGSDPMKEVFLAALAKAHVAPLLAYSSKPTQQVLCIITPDKQRTCRCYLGAMTEFNAEDIQEKDFEDVRLVHIEGYLVYNPGVIEKTEAIVKDKNIIVSMDVGCYQIASAYKDKIFSMLGTTVDILFANADEAFALTSLPPAEACALLQTKCPIAVILMGPDGCLIGHEGQVVHVPTTDVHVEDTVSAGDYFAAGFLHGILHDLPILKCAQIGNLTGGAIVQVGGTCLPDEQWPVIEAKIEEIKRR